MDEDKVRKRRSYNEFKEWLQFLKTNPDNSDLLVKFHGIKDTSGGYGSQRNADAAWESLQLLLKENRLEVSDGN